VNRTHLLALSIALALQPALVLANTSADTSAASSADPLQLDAISVIGEGETRQVQKLSPADLQRSAPGTSPLKVMSRLPGVNFTSSDPFGAYEWSTRITVRGFNQNQLGFTLDGIPLGDMSYGNHNGLHISRAALSENIDRVELAQGAGGISTASTSNLGGTAQFFTRAPSLDPGLRVSQMVGSDSTTRSFLSIDTGERKGVSAFVSGVYASTDKWKGDGPQEQWQFNGKAVMASEQWMLTAYAATSRRQETDYGDLSLESQRRLGWDWDNYAPDWQRALNAARGQYSGAVNSLDDAYYLGRGLRDDDLAALTFDWQASDALAVQLLGYYHRNDGQGQWATPYRASSTAVPISIRTTEYDIERSGVIPSLSLALDGHTVSAGVWRENNVHGLQRNFYDLTAAPDRIFFYRDPDLRVFRQRFDIETSQYWLTDRIDLMDGRLSADVGFKGTEVEVVSTNLIGSRAGGRIVAKDSFLPQAGLRFGLGEGSELFASYTENLSAFRGGVNGPFSTSQTAFNTFAATLEPETSDTLELGVRLSTDAYKASLAVYTVDFQNRLLAIARCAGIVGCPSSFANVGDVRSTGAETTFVLRASDSIEWFNSLSYNRSEYRSDYLDGSTVVPVRGKRVVDAPELLFASELSYRSGGLEAHIGGKFTDERFITYTNDSKVEDFWLVDAGVSYSWDDLAMFESVKLGLSINNLLDKDYFATVGSNGFVTSDPQGLNYTLQSGAPRQFFLSLDLRY
jgi:iron complex outermembrane receptor protein